VAFFAGVLYFFYKKQQQKYKKLQQKKLQEQQRKYDEEQKQLQLQHQLEIQESEKQIIQLRNEKLQSEVEHKNSELASSAMNLVRKKEMLSKLKEDLADYKNIPDTEKAGKEFQKIIRVIDKELDHNEEWEQFAVHFDSVHTNYLKILKEKYPALTTSDLKLAAYLRLSLSSKEIAQLMNISIRGVETSRYRLRKKLELENEINLFDFLIRVADQP
jgi:DNA-binding CsgD family transcriptional regulator